MTPSLPHQLLVESLRLLAAPADAQVAALPPYVVVTDEVGSTFGDAFLLLPQLERAGLIPGAAAAVIRELDSWFESAPSDGSLADPSTLAVHPFWTHARELASDALRLLGEDGEEPKLALTTWTQAGQGW